MQGGNHELRQSCRVLLLLVLAGCGGGGSGGGASAPAQSNPQAAGAGAGSITASVAGLPANGARAVPTFESIGLYWTPPSDPGGGCPVIFRKLGDSAWRQGLDMWYDPANGQCRGSLVLLGPGTSYEIQMGMPDQMASAGLVATTWSEQFPIAQTITLAAGTRTTPLAITQGGSPSGYAAYEANTSGS